MPNSILLKGNVPSILRGPGIASSNYGTLAWTAKTAHILSLAIAVLILSGLWTYKERSIWNRNSLMVIIFIAATVLHLKFAALGWFLRYEAYLVALGIFVAVLVGFEYTSRTPQPTHRPSIPVAIEMCAAGLIFLALGPMWNSAFYAMKGIPQASRNIYEQQYQMGLFLGRFYRGDPAAANDIGAVSFLGDTRLVDLMGLGSLDTAKERRRGYLSEEQIDLLTRSDAVKVAVVYDRAFASEPVAHAGLPPQWVKVGQWRIFNNLICYDDRVSFFAVDPSEETRLIEALRQFASRLPSDIEQSGKYTTK